MADVAAQRLPQQDATRYHRWLQDDAVKLQMQEVLGNWDLFQFAPDPMVAKALFVGLCFVRHSDQFRNDLDDVVERLRHQPNWITFTSWWTMRQYGVIHSPMEYPFSLTEDEFTDYSIKNFGGRFPRVEGTWHPHSFYRAVLQDVASIVMGFIAAKGAEIAVTRMAGVQALSEAGWAGAATRWGISRGGAVATHELFPGHPMDVAEKNMLFPRYMLEFNRRSLR